MTTADQSPIDSGLLEALAEIRERVGSNEESPILKVMRAHPEYSLEDVCRMLTPLTTHWESVTHAADGFTLGNQSWNLRAYGLSPTQIGRHARLSEEAVSDAISEYLDRSEKERNDA